MNRTNHRMTIIRILFAQLLLLCATDGFAYDIQNPYGTIEAVKTQNFGMFRKYSDGSEEFHNGVDLDGSLNGRVRPNIHAVAPGTVVFSRWGKYGNKDTYCATIEPHSTIRAYGRTV